MPKRTTTRSSRASTETHHRNDEVPQRNKAKLNATDENSERDDCIADNVGEFKGVSNGQLTILTATALNFMMICLFLLLLYSSVARQAELNAERFIIPIDRTSPRWFMGTADVDLVPRPDDHLEDTETKPMQSPVKRAQKTPASSSTRRPPANNPTQWSSPSLPPSPTPATKKAKVLRPSSTLTPTTPPIPPPTPTPSSESSQFQEATPIRDSEPLASKSARSGFPPDAKIAVLWNDETLKDTADEDLLWSASAVAEMALSAGKGGIDLISLTSAVFLDRSFYPYRQRVVDTIVRQQLRKQEEHERSAGSTSSPSNVKWLMLDKPYIRKLLPKTWHVSYKLSVEETLAFLDGITQEFQYQALYILDGSLALHLSTTASSSLLRLKKAGVFSVGTSFDLSSSHTLERKIVSAVPFPALQALYPDMHRYRTTETHLFIPSPSPLVSAVSEPTLEPSRIDDTDPLLLCSLSQHGGIMRSRRILKLYLDQRRAMLPLEITFIGDRFAPNMNVERFIGEIHASPDATYRPQLTEEGGRISAKHRRWIERRCDIGVIWTRSAPVDQKQQEFAQILMNQLHVFGGAGIPVLISASPLAEALLGQDYPLIFDDEDTASVLLAELVGEEIGAEKYKAAAITTFATALEWRQYSTHDTFYRFMNK